MRQHRVKAVNFDMLLLLLTSYTAFTHRIFFTLKSMLNTMVDTSGEITDDKTSQVLYEMKVV